MAESRMMERIRRLRERRNAMRKSVGDPTSTSLIEQRRREKNIADPVSGGPVVDLMQQGVEAEASRFNVDQQLEGPPIPGEVTGEVGVAGGRNVAAHVDLVSRGEMTVDDVVTGTMGMMAQKNDGPDNVRLELDPNENRGVYIKRADGSWQFDRDTSKALFEVINESQRVKRAKARENPPLLSAGQRAQFEALGGDPKREEAYLRAIAPHAKLGFDTELKSWVVDTPERGPQFINEPGADLKDIGAVGTMAARELPGALAQTVATVRGAGPAGVAAAGAAGDAGSAFVENMIRPHLPGQENIPSEGRGTELAFDVAERVGSGLVGEAAGRGVRAVGRKVGPFIPGQTGRDIAAGNLARRAAGESGEQTLGSVADETVQEFASKSQKINRRFNQLLRDAGSEKRLDLDAAQATGSPSLMAAKDTLRTLPETANKILRNDAKQIDALETATEALVNRIADNPKGLSMASVVRQAASAGKKEFDFLVDARRRTGNALFADTMKQSGKKRFVDVQPTRELMEELIEEQDFSRFGPALKKDLERLMKKADVGEDGSARVTAMAAHAFRSKWTDVLGGKDTIFAALERGNRKERMIATRIVKSIEEGFERTIDAGGTDAASIKSLRNAMSMYRAQSEAIDETVNDTVKRLIKVGVGAKPQRMMSEIANMNEGEIAELFGFLDEFSPNSAADLRAQYLKSVFQKANAGLGGHTFGADVPGKTLQPGRLLRELDKPERRHVMESMFGKKDAEDIKAVMEVLGRITNDPKIMNSATATRVHFRDAALKLDRAGLTERLSTLMVNAVKKGHFNADAVMKSLIDPVERARLVDTAAAIQAPGSVKGHVLKTAVNYLTRLGQGAAQSERRTQSAGAEQGLETAIRASRDEFTPIAPPQGAQSQQERDERRGAVRGGRF